MDRQPVVYDAGTLFVDLVDTRAKTLVWRGWAEGSMDGAIDDQAAMDARVDDAVMRILRRLPPTDAARWHALTLAAFASPPVRWGRLPRCRAPASVSI